MPDADHSPPCSNDHLLSPPPTILLNTSSTTTKPVSRSLNNSPKRRPSFPDGNHATVVVKKSPTTSTGGHQNHHNRNKTRSLSSNSSTDDELSSRVGTLEHSKKKTPSSTIPEPPDGGWGWVVVFASFMINLIADGVSLSFGLYFIDLSGYFNQGKGKTAWVGSLFLSLPLLTGPIASSLTDRYGCRRVCIVGAILAAGGFIASYFAESLEVLFLTFSISGFGLALCYVTSIVIVAYYFEKRRSLATGLAVCGTGIGTFVFAPLVNFLLKTYAWRGTFLVLSGLFLNIVVFGALMRDIEMPLRGHHSSGGSVTEDDSSKGSIESEEQEDGDKNLEDVSERLCSSLVQLPTYITNDRIPFEVISEISSKERGHLNTLLEHYPNIWNNILLSHYAPVKQQNIPVDVVVRLPNGHTDGKPSSTLVVAGSQKLIPGSTVGSRPQRRESRKSSAGAATIKESSPADGPARPPDWWERRLTQRTDSACLRNMRLQRGSLTYRGAMLNIHRYRLKASSCPDIYRNSMMTISEESKACQFLRDMKDVLVDMMDVSMFKNFRYTLFCISNFLLNACVDNPYVYIPDNANSLGMDPENSALLISILGILNTLGVVIVGYVGDKPWLDPSLLYSLCTAISGAAVGMVPLVSDYISLSLISAVYGFTISANYTLVPVIIVNLISLDNFTGAYGLLLLIQGVAGLIGTPLAGWLYDVTGAYNATFYMTGICIMMSSVIVIPVAKTWDCHRSVPTTLHEAAEEEELESFHRTERVRFQGIDGQKDIPSPTSASDLNDLSTSNHLNTTREPDAYIIDHLDRINEHDVLNGTLVHSNGEIPLVGCKLTAHHPPAAISETQSLLQQNNPIT